MTPTEYVIAKLATKHGLDRMAAALRAARRVLDQGEAALAAARSALEAAQPRHGDRCGASRSGSSIGPWWVCGLALGHEGPCVAEEAARRPEERDHMATGEPRTCDVKGCKHPIVYYCGCGRCDREPSPKEAFFSCFLHQYAVGCTHLAVRERDAVWYVGGPESRAAYLRK